VPHALVIGGSVGGLFAASLLRAQGWTATIYERSTGDLAGRGAGIGISQELLDAMRRVGAQFDPSVGIPIDHYAWFDRTGAVRHEIPRRMGATAWARIYQPLRAAFPDAHYRAGIALERVEQDANSVTGIFSDGSRVAGDLLVAADGNLSTVRKQYMPEVEPRYAGYVAWRGMLAERDLPAKARDAITRRIAYSFEGREMMLTMLSPDMAGDARAGHRGCYFIWYRPTESEPELRSLFTDASGRDHGAAIPPPLIRPELVAEVKSRAQEIFAPALAEVVRQVKLPLLQAISDMEAPRLVFGRAVLLGDSAFVARPHVAGGITKAALDAEALVRELAEAKDDVPAALAAYEKSQRDFGAKLVAHARALGSYVDRDPQRGTRFHDPRNVMFEYGAPHLLHDPDIRAFAVGGA
jgi:2-polyprenyl-6-methoxyphenol hydroxylase-like FAD-dependent oxidoreductase